MTEQESDDAKAATHVGDTEPKDSETENEESEVEGEAGEDGGTDSEEDEDTEGDADELSARQVMHDFTFHLWRPSHPKLEFKSITHDPARDNSACQCSSNSVRWRRAL